MADADARALVAALTRRVYGPAAVYAHAWQPGDRVIADNFVLLHGRTPYRSKLPRRRHSTCTCCDGGEPASVGRAESARPDAGREWRTEVERDAIPRGIGFPIRVVRTRYPTSGLADSTRPALVINPAAGLRDKDLQRGNRGLSPKPMNVYFGLEADCRTERWLRELVDAASARSDRPGRAPPDARVAGRVGGRRHHVLLGQAGHGPVDAVRAERAVRRPDGIGSAPRAVGYWLTCRGYSPTRCPVVLAPDLSRQAFPPHPPRSAATLSPKGGGGARRSALVVNRPPV